MRVSIRISLVVALLTGLALSQTETQPSFEAAEISPAPKTGNRNQFLRGPFTGGGRFELRGGTMVDFITKAYGVEDDKVRGGPPWLEYDRFDVRAITPPNTTSETAKLMLQALLSDRFKLVVRREQQPLAAYNLTLGKGKRKLKEADGSGDTGCRSRIEGLPNGPAAAGDAAAPINISALTIVYSCKNMTMEAFTTAMRNMGNDIPGNNPVIDQTDLKGAWDFDFRLSLALRGLNADTSSTPITLPDALDKQLGLKLEPTKIPQQVIAVESVNRTPSPNSPDIAQKFPAAPTEFEVADIRPGAPPSGDGPVRIGLQIQPGGRVNITNMPLRTLILQAWNINQDMLVGLPKFAEADRYDIIAKAPTNSILTGTLPVNAPPGVAPPLDNDAVWSMVQKLLVDRFQIKQHMEDRPAVAYDLVAVRPKLKKADPASRTKWSTPPIGDSKDPRNVNPSASQLLAIQNMTMAQFGEVLQNFANGYIHSPILDKTGLEGSYDFTLNFSPIGALNGGGRGGVIVFSNGGGTSVAIAAGPAGGGNGDASEPNGTISLFDAIEKQLGLKLVEINVPFPSWSSIIWSKNPAIISSDDDANQFPKLLRGKYCRLLS